MLRNVVERISDEFVDEAISSPNLLSDMASMEKYMAESYSGRVFVELLQNADDCFSKRILVKEFNGNLLFANDGRPFDENDLISICRSGSSSKKRGESIGYRGVGFKSTTYLTDEIVVFSDDSYFTFSKKECSKKLSLPIENIPMIRIPLLVESIETELETEIQLLKKDGYNTVFIFKNVRMNEFLEEVNQISNSLFIFLNSIEECIIQMSKYKKRIVMQRFNKRDGQVVSFNDADKSGWYIVKHKDTAIGFKYDREKNCIVACEDKDALYHSYLPSLDKFIFPFKVNADFSTDPSRKHIYYDAKTEEAIYSIAENISVVIEKAFSNNSEIHLYDIFSIINKNNSFSRCNSELKKCLKDLITNNIKLKIQNGANIPISKYKLLPDWLSVSEKVFIRQESKVISSISLDSNLYKTSFDIESFISNYSSCFVNNEDLVEMMCDAEFVKKLPLELQGKITGHIIRSSKFESIPEIKAREIKITTDKGVRSLKDIKANEDSLVKGVQDGLDSVASDSDINWFNKTNSVTIRKEPAKLVKQDDRIVSSVKKTIKPHISKWRSAECQCIEIEEFFGNNARDVSKMNVGYDIESTTKYGEKRYIEVKSIKEDGSFSITNNEYTAAHQYGDQYYLCLLIQSPQNIQAIYVQNPIKNIDFEKRVKQWEWYCDSYCGDSFIFENE